MKTRFERNFLRVVMVVCLFLIFTIISNFAGAHPVSDCPFQPATQQKVKDLLGCETIESLPQERLSFDFIYDKNTGYVNRFTNCEYVRDSCLVIEEAEGKVSISWVRPTTRKDGTPLKGDEVITYRVRATVDGYDVDFNGAPYVETKETFILDDREVTGYVCGYVRSIIDGVISQGEQSVCKDI